MTVDSVDKMIDDFNNGTYDLTCNGKCTGCGECCSNILAMTDAEIKRIRKYIKLHKIEEHKSGIYLANPICDMTCPFLNDKKDHRCNIYEVRPQICRTFSCHKENRPQIPCSLMARPIDVRATFYSGKPLMQILLGGNTK